MSDSSIVIQNYSCAESGFLTSKVFTSNNLNLEFTFGESVAQTINAEQAINALVAGVDLEPSKSANDTFPIVGQVVRYTIFLENLGDTDATDITVSDNIVTLSGLTLTGDFEAIPATFGGFSSEFDTGTGIWTVSSLDAGDTISLSYDVLIEPEAEGVAILNTATSIASTPTDVNPGNDPDNAIVIVQITRVDLVLTKTPSNLTPAAGTTVTYTLNVSNLGPNSASNVVILDPLSAPELSFVSSPDGCFLNGGGVVECNIATIPSGGSASFDIVVLITSDAFGLIDNTSTVTNDEEEIDLLNN